MHWIIPYCLYFLLDIDTGDGFEQNSKGQVEFLEK